MPILFHVERNNLITQCIMKFKFFIHYYDGFSLSIEKVFTSIDAAKEWAKEMVMNLYFVESVTLYSLLTDDSCGPIRYIDEFRYEDL